MKCFGVMFMLLLSLGSFAGGEGSLHMPSELQGIQIDDKPGAQLPLDLPLVDHEGRALKLGNYFNTGDGLPVVMAVGYYGCPMLCGLVLKGLTDVMQKASFKLGKDYNVISVSIDHREKQDLAKAKRANFLTSLGVDTNTALWPFHVTEEKDIKKLAETIGFNFRYDPKSDQYAHGAGIFVFSPTGVLSRVLWGIEYKPMDFRLAIVEASQGKVGSFADKVLLSCFHFDPDSHKYGVYIFGVMRLAGLITIVILGSFLLLQFRRERKPALVR
jgi:protein SCO1/2